MHIRWLWFGLSAATALAISTPTAAGEPIPAETSASEHPSQAFPSWLLGVWTRDWIEEQGRRSSTLDVHYLQTPGFVGDVRIPVDRPTFPNATSFADLSDQELHVLARQQGFAGRTTLVGTVATWHHQVDFQPSDGQEDAGRLELAATGRMYEHGLDGGYRESWRSATDGHGQFLVIQTESGGRTRRLLLLAGDYFLYARNRNEDLPASPSLEALIKSTGATRAQVIEYLDCEFSFGRIRGGPMAWEIQRSTLPWREGHRLDFVDQVELENGGKGIRLRTAQSERWRVLINTLKGPELAAVFGRDRRR
jgi:hypothetical protein